jgi:hypothetical protein
VERIPDAVPPALDDAPADPGLENRARQVPEEERGIVRCAVAEFQVADRDLSYDLVCN